MAKRGRPMLNLSPEERLARRRAQVTNSQRKLRAGKRRGGSRPNGNHAEPNRISSDTWAPSAQQLDYALRGCGDATTHPQFIDLHGLHKDTRQVHRLEHQVAGVTNPFYGRTSDIAVPVTVMSLSPPASNLSPNLSQRTDAHSGLVMIDHPTEKLPLSDDVVIIDQSYGEDARDASTELLPWANYLAVDHQPYDIDGCDLFQGASAFADDLDISTNYHGASMYADFNNGLHISQPRLPFSSSTLECSFVSAARNAQSMNGLTSRPCEILNACLSEMEAVVSGTTPWCIHSDPQRLTTLPELAQAYPQMTVDPSLIFV